MLPPSRYQSAIARVRNAFGGAETFEANASIGTKTRRSLHASFSAPISSDLATRASLSVYALDRDNSTFASCTEGLRGAKAAIQVSIRPSHGCFDGNYVLINPRSMATRVQVSTNSATRLF